LVPLLGAVLAAVVLPSVVLWVLIGEFAAIGMFVSVLLGGVGARLGGTRRMTWVAPAVGLAAGSPRTTGGGVAPH
jgi:hypothetical protein